MQIAGKLKAYSVKSSVSGICGYAPWSTAVITFMMDETYQGMVRHLNAHRKILEKLGLNSMPSKSTIHRASERIPKSYYRQMYYQIVVSITAGNLTGGSSGFLMRKFIPWFSVRKNSHMFKRVCHNL